LRERGSLERCDPDHARGGRCTDWGYLGAHYANDAGAVLGAAQDAGTCPGIPLDASNTLGITEDAGSDRGKATDSGL
jgi:hypothetical protein